MGNYISKNNHPQTPNTPQQINQNLVSSFVCLSMEDIPANVTVDILSRLPVKTIIHCKCVSKKWRNLLSESYFVNLHLSRSPACLIFHHFTVQEMHNNGLGILKLVEIQDELVLRHDPIMTFDLNLAALPKMIRKLPVGSVHGFICLKEFGNGGDNTYICNPITREYMMLPKHYFFLESTDHMVVYGFGVGSLTREYKVIRTFLMHVPPNPESSRPDLLEAEVYTLGTGKWRRLGRVPYWLDGYEGPFLNGNVHWVVRDQDLPEKLCAFDIDNETFQLFPSPPFDAMKQEPEIRLRSLGVLNGCLTQCDSRYTDVTIWVMKEYGVKKSWSKMVNIRQSRCPQLLMFEPISLLQGFKDGNILMVHYQEKLLAYHPKTNAIQDLKMFNGLLMGITYRPSLLKLKNFEPERVRVL